MLRSLHSKRTSLCDRIHSAITHHATLPDTHTQISLRGLQDRSRTSIYKQTGKYQNQENTREDGNKKLWTTVLSSGQGKQDDKPQVYDYLQVHGLKAGGHREPWPSRVKTRERERERKGGQNTNKTICSLARPTRQIHGPWQDQVNSIK